MSEDNKSIQVNDLAAVRDILKVAIERAAFKAEEVAGVGMIFNKFNAFVDHMLTLSTPEPTDSEVTETSTETKVEVNETLTEKE